MQSLQGGESMSEIKDKYKLVQLKEMEGKRLSVKEVTELYGVSKRAVYNWFEEGLRYEVEKVIGRKPYKVTTAEEIERFIRNKYL